MWLNLMTGVDLFVESIAKEITTNDALKFKAVMLGNTWRNDHEMRPRFFVSQHYSNITNYGFIKNIAYVYYCKY